MVGMKDICIVCRYSNALEFEDGFFHADCYKRYESAREYLKLYYGYRKPTSEFLAKFPDYNPMENVGYGWWGILINLVEFLRLIKPGFTVDQIKEKFGGLRFYDWGLPTEGRTLIDWAESISYQICEVCGDHGKLRNMGWMKTLCDEHARERYGEEE